MHIVIIGAGISGLLTALELVEQNCQVSIYDQQSVGQGASWAGGGILSPMYPWRYPQAVNQLAQHAKTLYQALNHKLYASTGIDFEINQTGLLIFDQDDFDVGLHYAEQHQEPMQRAYHVQQDTLKAINPQIGTHFSQAMHFPDIANIRNPRLLQSVKAYLRQHPAVQFFEHCPIIKLQHEHSQIVYVLDANKNKITADQFVITTGAWSQHWTQQLNLHIPVKPVQGQIVLFKAPSDWLPTMCMNKVMYLIPRKDGHILCGSSMAERGFDTTTDLNTRHDILKASFEMVPDLAQFPIVQQWAGLRPGSPDGIPYIGKVPHIDNLWLNTGHFRNGLCMGPASAQLLRQLMLQQKSSIDPSPYSLQRLTSL